MKNFQTIRADNGTSSNGSALKVPKAKALLRNAGGNPLPHPDTHFNILFF